METCLKVDIPISAAELVFGTTFRLTGEFFTPGNHGLLAAQPYTAHLSMHVRNLLSILGPSQGRQVPVPAEPEPCLHVFISIDLIYRPLHVPYECSISVISCHCNTFEGDPLRRISMASIDRLKVISFAGGILLISKLSIVNTVWFLTVLLCHTRACYHLCLLRLRMTLVSRLQASGQLILLSLDKNTN